MGQTLDSVGALLTNDGSAWSPEIEWKRDVELAFTLYTPALGVFSLVSKSVSLAIRERPYGSPVLLTKAATSINAAAGTGVFVIAKTELATLTWEFGERFRVLWCDVTVIETAGGAERSVRDGAANFVFPLRVWQSLRGVPS